MARTFSTTNTPKITKTTVQTTITTTTDKIGNNIQGRKTHRRRHKSKIEVIKLATQIADELSTLSDDLYKIAIESKRKRRSLSNLADYWLSGAFLTNYHNDRRITDLINKEDFQFSEIKEKEDIEQIQHIFAQQSLSLELLQQAGCSLLDKTARNTMLSQLQYTYLGTELKIVRAIQSCINHEIPAQIGNKFLKEYGHQLNDEKTCIKIKQGQAIKCKFDGINIQETSRDNFEINMLMTITVPIIDKDKEVWNIYAFPRKVSAEARQIAEKIADDYTATTSEPEVTTVVTKTTEGLNEVREALKLFQQFTKYVKSRQKRQTHHLLMQWTDLPKVAILDSKGDLVGTTKTSIYDNFIFIIDIQPTEKLRIENNKVEAINKNVHATIFNTNEECVIRTIPKAEIIAVLPMTDSIQVFHQNEKRAKKCTTACLLTPNSTAICGNEKIENKWEKNYTINWTDLIDIKFEQENLKIRNALEKALEVDKHALDHVRLRSQNRFLRNFKPERKTVLIIIFSLITFLVFVVLAICVFRTLKNKAKI